MFCSRCGTAAGIDAAYCSKCGTQLLQQQPVVSPALSKMSGSVRKGSMQARFNERYMGVITFEILVIAIAAGVSIKSWWAFGGCLVALMTLIQVRQLAMLFAVLLGIGWGVAGYGIGTLFGSDGAPLVLAALAFLIGLGANVAGIQWLQDVASE